MTARPGPGTPGAVVYATDHRRALAAFMAPASASDPLATRSGIVHAPGRPLQVRQNTPLGMSALVNPGNAEIHRAGRGTYTPYNDAVETVAFEPAPATNSRYDLVYLGQADEDVDDDSQTTIGVLTGEATASAPKPYDDLPAGALALAEVGPIAVGTTQITDALIANVAPFAAVRGTPIPVRSLAERDALDEIASAAHPITVERLDTGRIERNTGTGWADLQPDVSDFPHVGGVSGAWYDRPVIIAENRLLTTASNGSVMLDLSGRLSAVHYFDITGVTGTPKTAVITNASPASFTFNVYSGTAAVASSTFNARIFAVGEPAA